MVDLTRLKVCFLAGCLTQGGAERQLYYILRSLRQVGAAPRLLCLTRGDYWEEPIRQLGVPVTWVGRSASRFRRLAEIVAVLRKHKPHVVQAQHSFANLYAVGAARILGSREIGAIRDNAIDGVRTIGPILGRLSLRAPRLLAVNSRQAMQNAVDLGVPASRLMYLPNVVDTRTFEPFSRQGTTNGFVRLLSVGRLDSGKRVDLFLETVAHLRKDSSVMVRASIVGDGSERANLEQRAVELGLLPHVVEFRGRVSNMATVYREAEILVLTSGFEGTPNVVLEAMACGLPVVATTVGGVPEVVQDAVTGYLVEPGNVGMLVDRLTKLCHDSSLRAALGRAARQYVVANHAPSRLPQSLQQLYGAVLS